MQELNDDPLMIVRGQLSTLTRERNAQRKAAAEIVSKISGFALDVNRQLNDMDAQQAKTVVSLIPDNVMALISLCNSIEALQAQIKPLLPIAWPSGRIDE
jgi:hypothetical protein